MIIKLNKYFNTNIALLAKWRWQFLLGDGGIWKNIIYIRYVAAILLLILVVGPPSFVGRPRGCRIFPS